MKDHEYEVVINYIRRSDENLLAVQDELEEFGTDVMDRAFLSEIKGLRKKLRDLSNRVVNHQKVLSFIRD